MKLSPEEITNNSEYNHILTLSFLDIVPFVITYLKKRSIVTIIATALLVCAILLSVWVRLGLGQTYSFLTILPYTISGLVIIPLLLIIPHELLHILPYYAYGAREIKVGANIKDFYFFVTAHNFPIKSSRYIIIAVLPMLIISITLLLLLLFSTNTLWSWSYILAGITHFTMCSGDIALVNFIYLNRGKQILTWDNVERKEAYFYTTS